MNRSISFERVYTVGAYQTARFGDTINEIPEELAFNPDVISALRMLQIIQTEKAFFNYQKKKDIIHAHSIEDALALLEEAGQQSVRNLKEVLDNVNNDEDGE